LRRAWRKLETIIYNKLEGASAFVCICSSHQSIVEAAIRKISRDRLSNVIIEATGNQVNQFGGYSGLTPFEYKQSINSIAESFGMSRDCIFLGGDHLGPLPWKMEPANSAMRKARTLVRDFAAAGFQKLHIDTSVACADDIGGISQEEIIRRAVDLIEVAESAFVDTPPSYIIGTEVPKAGGVKSEKIRAPTNPKLIHKNYIAHVAALREKGLNRAANSILAAVAYTGVEFSTNTLIRSEQFSQRHSFFDDYGYGLEAHSTDYQSEQTLNKLVKSGYKFLKVGPELTFVLRSVLFTLETLERTVVPIHLRSNLEKTLRSVMKTNPAYWHAHHSRDSDMEMVLYSMLDRSRYYWNDERVQKALKVLRRNINMYDIPDAIWATTYGELPSTVRYSFDQVITTSLERTLNRFLRSTVC